jgi:transposase
MVERCFNKLKNARRLATRYDKTADSYLGFIHLVSIRMWMREFVNAS